MGVFLGRLGGCLMVAFVLLLALRGLARLGWLPRPALACLPAFLKTPSSPCRLQEARPPAWRVQAGVFLAGVAALWLFALLGWLTLGQPGGLPAFWGHFWQRFTTAGDSPHYLFLARYGYQPAGEKANLLVFYPLYPLCIRALAAVTGSYEASGLVVSQVCWGLACVTLLRLAALYWPVRRAVWAVAFFALYPFSFFGLGVYTEGLFLLLCLQCLYRLQLGQWGRAGALGFLAALCRVQGLLLFLPAVYLWLTSVRRGQRQGVRGLALLLIPAGFGAYLLLNRAVSGQWFRFLEYEAAPPWYQSTRWVAQNLAQHYDMALAHPGLARFIYWPQLALYFIAMGLLLYGLFTAAPTSWLLYGGAYLGMSYLAGWLISGGRYMLGCLPLYLLLARPRRAWVRALWLGGTAAACFFYNMYFMQGQAIM